MAKPAVLVPYEILYRIVFVCLMRKDRDQLLALMGIPSNTEKS